jgi:hypothetical protein
LASGFAAAAGFGLASTAFASAAFGVDFLAGWAATADRLTFLALALAGLAFALANGFFLADALAFVARFEAFFAPGLAALRLGAALLADFEGFDRFAAFRLAIALVLSEP